MSVVTDRWSFYERGPGGWPDVVSQADEFAAGIKRRWLLGSSPQADVVVEGAEAFHAEIILHAEGGAFYARDLGSRYGTFMEITRPGLRDPERSYLGGCWTPLRGWKVRRLGLRPRLFTNPIYVELAEAIEGYEP